MLPWSSFDLEDRHHLRTDLRQNPSFLSRAEGGFGVHAGAGLAWTWRRLSLEAGWEFFDLKSGHGAKFTRPVGQRPVRDRLNDITIERLGPYLGLR